MGHYDSNDDSGVPSFVIWIGVLIVANVLLAAFDAPFWIY